MRQIEVLDFENAVAAGSQIYRATNTAQAIVATEDVECEGHVYKGGGYWVKAFTDKGDAYTYYLSEEQFKTAWAIDEAPHLKAEIEVLKEALKEAGDFAMKRLPHDARETGATSEYFQAMFMENATNALKYKKEQN